MMNDRMSLSTILSFIILCISSFAQIRQAHTHGGIPRVLSIYPPEQEEAPLWMIDTLGIFKAQRAQNSPAMTPSWFWLCDDAVDPTLGVDDLVVIDEQNFIAVARSGLYRSHDGGCSFTRVDEDLNQYALGSLSLHPNRNHVVVYSDSIGRDNSVWWSDDQGHNWTKSSFSVTGTIYKLWRNPLKPMEIWINHAQGLSQSTDGGQNFEAVETQGYGLDLSPNEIRLLGGGQLGEYEALFVALNRFPTASLLMSLDQGLTWRVIHQAEDSYDSILLSSNALWLPTPFEGLFIYPLDDAERLNSSEAWSRDRWIQNESVFISCLVADPIIPQRVWSCGRSSPSDWLIAYSDNQAESWTIEMATYAVAAGTTWACSETSTSQIACQARCLDANCDPSGIEPPIMMSSDSDTSSLRDQSINPEQDSTSPENQGCLQTKTTYISASQQPFKHLLWFIYFLPLYFIKHVTRIRR